MARHLIGRTSDVAFRRYVSDLLDLGCLAESAYLGCSRSARPGSAIARSISSRHACGTESRRNPRNESGRIWVLGAEFQAIVGRDPRSKTSERPKRIGYALGASSRDVLLRVDQRGVNPAAQVRARFARHAPSCALPLRILENIGATAAAFCNSASLRVRGSSRRLCSGPPKIHTIRKHY